MLATKKSPTTVLPGGWQVPRQRGSTFNNPCPDVATHDSDAHPNDHPNPNRNSILLGTAKTRSTRSSPWSGSGSATARGGSNTAQSPGEETKDRDMRNSTVTCSDTKDLYGRYAQVEDSSPNSFHPRGPMCAMPHFLYARGQISRSEKPSRQFFLVALLRVACWV